MRPKNTKTIAEEIVQPRSLAPTTRYYFFVFVLAAISLWIRSGFPVNVINRPHDDLLFIRLADHLGSGNWLGPYDETTLAKGMFYPMFIAFVHATGVPLKIAEQIGYLAVCGLTVELLRRKTASNLFALVLFATLAFNPVLWNSYLARVIREALYLSLSLALVLGLVLMFCASRISRPHLLYPILCGIGVGLLGGAFWLTREEGIWLAPALGVVILIGAWRTLKPAAAPPSDHPDPSQYSTQMKAVALSMGLAVLAFFAVDLLVAGVNYRHYGIFETNEFRAKSFLRAYGALTRIHHDDWQPYVLFPKDARERAYAVSPAAHELKPGFEGIYAEGWRQAGCLTASISPCPAEVLAGWFMWEFRAAVAKAGHYRSASEAMSFYDHLADEIDAACTQGAIECSPQSDKLSPPFRWEYLGHSITAAAATARIMFTLREGPVGSLPSSGPAQAVSLVSRIVGGVSPPDKLVLQGWAGAISALPTVRIVSHGSQEYPVSATIEPSQDLAARFPNLKVVRFQLETSCPPPSCDLLVEAPGADPVKTPLASLASRQVPSLHPILLMVKDATFSEAALPDTEHRSTQVWTASILSWGYAIMIPILSVLATASLVLAAAFKRLRAIPTELPALVLASAAAIFTRIALLAYITATSFPAANLLYSSPASPFVILFAIGGTYCGYLALSARSAPIAQEVSSPVGDAVPNPSPRLKRKR